jgi:hypothetical protein
MRYWFLLFGLTGLLPGQGAGDLFNRAPAGVEEAARARVSQYFKFQMEGQFRQAEALVCEAGRDAYYDMEKTRWKSFEIVKASFEDNFQTAKVVVLLGTTMNTPQGSLDANYPYVSTWKLEQGNWCFYIDPVRAKSRETPFGTTNAGPGDGRDGVGGGSPFVTQDQVLASLKRGVRVTPQEVLLSSFEKSSAKVEIVNNLNGQIEVQVMNAPRRGLTVKLASSVVGPNSSTMLLLDYDPPDQTAKERLELKLNVSPSGQVIPVTVDFAIPPSVQEQIPENLRKPQKP